MSLLSKTQIDTTEKQDDTLLLLKDIRKDYPGGFSLDVDQLKFRRGQVHVIMGPNGSGKTALLNIAGLMARPDEGKVVLGPDAGMSAANGDPATRRKIGFVMQDSFLFNRSVHHNVAYGLKIRKVPRKEITGRVSKALRTMGIEHLKGRNVNTLSGGEKKRVAIAQVLALDTDIILMDEPMAHVDNATVFVIGKLLREFKRQKAKTVVVTTHSTDRAYRLSEEIISMKAGRVTDFIYENTFYGVVRDSGDGIGRMSIAEDIDIFLVPREYGQVHVAIDPENILLSRDRLVSSARNLFYGTITKVEDLDVNVRVFVDCGVEFCAMITKRSYAQMDLNIGSHVYLSFKVNSVKII